MSKPIYKYTLSNKNTHVIVSRQSGVNYESLICTYQEFYEMFDRIDTDYCIEKTLYKQLK